MNNNLHDLMLKCKEGSRVGVVSVCDDMVSLMWWYGSDHHSEIVSKEDVNGVNAGLYKALERATNSMK